ncbi:MAG: MltA domain-containing protein [Alphaproteobacteria bacterium]
MSPTTMLKSLALLLTTFAAIWLPACAPPPSHPYWDMPPFGADDVTLYRAFESSCTKLRNQPAGAAIRNGAGQNFGTYGQWHSICAEALAATPDQLPLILSARTEQRQMHATNAQPAKFTGYFKPMLEASLTQGGPYQTPLLAKPADLTECADGSTGRILPDGTCGPYATRGEIETDVRTNPASIYKPIAWLKDPVAAFILHVQGSGTLELPDGTLRNVGFAAKNGHNYVAIGKALRELGELSPPITADDIRKWLKAHPERRDEILHLNPSYIFFTLTKEESVGAYNIKLTPGRSLAVDRQHIPMGVPLRVATTLTSGEDEEFDRLMFGHDVGSAIKGPVRGDIYFGHGPAAGKAASSQNASGKLWVLVPKN